MKAVRTKTLLTIATLVASWIPSTIHAQTTGRKGQLELGVYSLFTRFDRASVGLDQKIGAGGRMGFFFSNRFSLEASGDFTETATIVAGEAVSVARLGTTLYGQKRFVGSNTLYLGLGYERLFYRAAQNFNDNGIHLSLGNRLPLGGRAVLRLEGRASYFPSSPAKLAGDQVFHLSATAGISVFSFGGPPRDEDVDGVRDRNDDCAGTPRGAFVNEAGCPSDEDVDGILTGLDQCPDTPTGANVDPAGCPTDSDRDAIFDGIDTCPDTPMGARVDGIGCPSDDDGDLIFNGIDQCPSTPVGAIVDAVGCPSDEDLDGVFDGIDQCAGTPVGALVDATGCPSDNDGDGVVNTIDQCPNSPTGTTVNEVGCPPERDSDLDGVMDSADRCPDTAPGQQVDAVGCPILFVIEESGEAVPLVLKGVNFATGRSTLTPASYGILDDVAASLIGNPDIRIEVSGHTDNTGSLQTNTRLSQARAEAVRAYLAQKGVEVERMEARGYGPDQPTATNSSVEGRALNRRVELRLISQ